MTRRHPSPLARPWLALLAALPLFCALSASPQAQYRIAGRVVNSVGGDPVRGAMVTVLAEEDRSVVATVRSDSEGYFSIDNLPANKYPLTASKRGFRTAYYDEHGDYNTAIVTGEGQDTQHLVFELTPGAVLHGVISDDAGDPVEGASVLLSNRKNARSPGTRIPGVQTTQTDDQGEYEFSNLAPGEYAIAVRGDPWYAQHSARSEPGGETSPLDVVFPITYYESTIDEAAAAPITLAGGDRQEADIVLHAVRALHLRLPVSTRQGAPREMRQTVFGVVQPANVDYRSDTPGSVEIVGLAPGHYEMTHGDPPRTLELDLTSNADLDPNAGTPSQTVSGRITGVAPLTEPVELYLASQDSNGDTFRASVQNSQFHFDAVPPGDWTLAVAIPANMTAFVTAAGAPVDHIAVRDKPVTVAVTLSRSQTRVQGFARRNGKPAVGVMVVLVPQEPALYRALVRRDQTDSDGSFSLREVPPGRYTVVAIDDGWKLDWEKRENLERYLPGGLPVTLTTQAGAIVSLPHPVEAAR